MTTDLTSLLRDVKVLCLDAGNTIIFLDHARLARLAASHGAKVTAAELIVAEGGAKLAQERGELLEVDFPGRDRPGAIGWGRTVATILHKAGVAEDAVRRMMGELWAEHCRLNFWSLVPDGFGAALDAARSKGIKTAVVSNSEGMLDALFRELGIRDHLDVLIDSGVAGVEKPDPRIFELALTAAGGSKEQALHLGDSIATDVLGARAAGVRVALIDPYGHCEGRALEVPRVSGVVEVARALAG